MVISTETERVFTWTVAISVTMDLDGDGLRRPSKVWEIEG